MEDFTLGDIWDLCSYDPNIDGLADQFGWWALGHNFDVIGAILAMSELSWQKGWDARDVIANMAHCPSRSCHPGEKCNNWPECESCGPPRL